MCFSRKIVYYFLFLSISSFAQIVDDSSKVIYGTNTTKLFTQETLYENKVYFFNRDSMFSRSFVPKKTQINFSKAVENPYLLLVPATVVAKDSIQNITDTITYFKKKKIVKDTMTHEDSVAKRYPRRFYKNHYKFDRVDTSVTDLHNYNYIYVKNNIYQNQGLLATPNKAVFYVAPTEIGYQSGHNTYDLFFTDPSKVQYFNTRSPYAKIDYYANTGDENKIAVEFSKNVYRNWNIGFKYTRLNSNRQMALTSRDRLFLASNQDFVLHSSFKSNDERYHFLGNFIYSVSKTNEQGGLVNSINQAGSVLELNQSNNPPANIGTWGVNLNATQSRLEPYITRNSIFSRDRRLSYHFYQQLDVIPRGILSVFHEFDRRNQRFTFGDPFAGQNMASTIEGVNFYPPSRRINDSIPFTIPKKDTSDATKKDSTVFRFNNNKDTIRYNQDFAFTTNKIGIKGTIAEKHTWIGYLKFRNIMWGDELSRLKVEEFVTDPTRSVGTWLLKDPRQRFQVNEYYVGGEYLAQLSDSLLFKIKGEIIYGNAASSQNVQSFDASKLNNQGNYSLSALLNYRNYALGLDRTVSSPFILSQFIDHNIFYWNNTPNFKPIESTVLFWTAEFKAESSLLRVKPSITTLYNYTYFNQKINPEQHSDLIYLWSADVFYHGNVGVLNLELFSKFSFTNAKSVMRFPEAYVNPKLYIKFQPKKKVWRQQFMFGLDFHYRSAYLGDAYMPAISQFYLQDNFLLSDYLLIDFFVDVKIRNARLFTRLNQMNFIFGEKAPSIINGNGYYVTPGYASVRQFLTFGLQWMLFD